MTIFIIACCAAVIGGCVVALFAWRDQELALATAQPQSDDQPEAAFARLGQQVLAEVAAVDTENEINELNTVDDEALFAELRLRIEESR